MSDSMQVESSTTMSDADSVTALKSQIDVLTDLYNRVTTLRNYPPLLLRSPTQPIRPPPPENNVHDQFSKLHQITDTIRSSSVQQALKHAQSSFNSDPAELNTNPRRENRKRRRPPTPGSPQPYVNAESTRPPLFPPLDSAALPLTCKDLHEYIIGFNKAHQSKLHIWQQTRPLSPSSVEPRILRLIIPDVLTCYITFGTKSHPDPTLVVETVTMFGPREKKAPHSQSNYTVFRQLSQQISKVLHLEPSTPLQSVIELLNSYDDLFLKPCSTCDRVLTSEGHIPPFVRAWSEADGIRQWDAKHINCRYTRERGL